MLGQVLGDGAEDLHGAQGGDEGGQLAVGDEHAVEPAQQRAEDQAHGDGDNRKYYERVLVKFRYGQYHTNYGQKYD